MYVCTFVLVNHNKLASICDNIQRIEQNQREYHRINAQVNVYTARTKFNRWRNSKRTLLRKNHAHRKLELHWKSINLRLITFSEIYVIKLFTFVLKISARAKKSRIRWANFRLRSLRTTNQRTAMKEKKRNAPLYHQETARLLSWSNSEWEVDENWRHQK